jgi:16S rRNA (guanine527-N7)-methyltransferase
MIVARELADSGCETFFRAGFLHRIETFATELARWGSKLNLTAAPDDPVEIAFHVIDSLAPLMLAQKAGPTVLAEAFASGTRVLDLGSGAGFPGLILAAACDAEFVLVEARRKRASFLSVTAAAMGLANVRVEASRADSTVLEPVFDLVTARAFAEPAIALQTAAAALRPGGLAMLYASPPQRPAIEAACAGDFEPPALLGYEVARGVTGVARVPHVLAVARRH